MGKHNSIVEMDEQEQNAELYNLTIKWDDLTMTFQQVQLKAVQQYMNRWFAEGALSFNLTKVTVF